MLEHNDGIIDDQTNRRCDAAQRHHVEAHAQRQQRNASRSKRRRKQRRCHHHQSPAAQEEEQHKARQKSPQKDGVADGVGGTRDQFGLIIIGTDFYIRRQPGALYPVFDRLDECDRIGSRRLANVD
jgi:hypothetical protein